LKWRVEPVSKNHRLNCQSSTMYCIVDIAASSHPDATPHPDVIPHQEHLTCTITNNSQQTRNEPCNQSSRLAFPFLTHKGLTSRQSPSSIDCKVILMPDRNFNHHNHLCSKLPEPESKKDVGGTPIWYSGHSCFRQGLQSGKGTS
jgi:hypothetical protein